MKRVFTMLALLTVTAASAQKYSFIKTSTKTFDRVKTDQVAVILDQNKVPADAEEIGLIVCKTDKDKKAFTKAKEMAARNGANCIYIKDVKEASNSDKWRAAVVGGSGGSDKRTFVAIRTKPL